MSDSAYDLLAAAVILQHHKKPWIDAFTCSFRRRMPPRAAKDWAGDALTIGAPHSTLAGYLHYVGSQMTTETIKLQISVPIQGVAWEGTPEEAIAWFSQEETLVAQIQPLLGSRLTVGNTHYELQSMPGVIQNRLRQLQNSLKSSNQEQFDRYLADALQMNVLIMQGDMGRQVLQLQSARNEIEAKWLATLWNTSSVPDNLKPILAPFAAIFKHSPQTLLAIDLSSSKAAKAEAESSRALSLDAASELDRFIADKQRSIDELSSLYREKLTIEEPAGHWQRVAKHKTLAWMAALAAFAVMCVVPLGVYLWKFQTVSEAIMKLTASASGTILLSGVVALTIPALMYAWLLRQISRLFVQNLMLADDASHRYSLAISYLGLMANERSEVSKEDRALILNALFRAPPTNPADDGPPAGLLDLIGKKN